ncbi:MAG: tRNA-uridine aminocarboxypropyltransferase [Myxococcales bacterium]|jgi:DTW domain-containing protein YfiP
MRSRTPDDLAGHCPRCLLREAACLCDCIPRVETRTQVLIVRHTKERLRTSNTARVAALALVRAQLLDIEAASDPIDPAPFREPGTWLLYPGQERAGRPEPAPRKLVVLDGSWRQTRRMYLHMPALRGLPVLSLPPPEIAPARLREQQRPEGHSTLEAIAAAIRFIEGEAAARPLEQLHEEIVRRVLKVRGRRHG